MPKRTSHPSKERSGIYRHSLAVRMTHWINAVCLAVLLMSGLQIFNAHSALYWGDSSDFKRPILAIAAREDDGKHIGVTEFLGHSYDTTGLLGVSGPSNATEARAFPAWITLPGYHDLATGRRWHFFFAWIFAINGLVYLVNSLFQRHVWRDLVPSRRQIRDIGRSFIDHLRLRFPKGEEAKHYNVLQQLSYLAIIFVVLPALALAGLTMSPGIDAAFPWLTALFFGRQSARTIHFIAANLIAGFVLVHVTMVLLSGVWNNLRSMITGWYAIEPAGDAREQQSDR